VGFQKDAKQAYERALMIALAEKPDAEALDQKIREYFEGSFGRLPDAVAAGNALCDGIHLECVRRHVWRVLVFCKNRGKDGYYWLCDQALRSREVTNLAEVGEVLAEEHVCPSCLQAEREVVLARQLGRFNSYSPPIAPL